LIEVMFLEVEAASLSWPGAKICQQCREVTESRLESKAIYSAPCAFMRAVDADELVVLVVLRKDMHMLKNENALHHFTISKAGRTLRLGAGRASTVLRR